MMAAGRAVADAAELIKDPFAGPLVRAAGVDFLTRIVDGDLDLSLVGDDGGFPRLAELFAGRTRLFDKFVVEAARAGMRQLVILASGLDSRAYRLWWPAGTTLYEIDQPRVIEFKTAAMRAWNVAPKLHRRAVIADLRRDWPTALLRAGFDAAAPTAWLAEGLLVGLIPPDAQDRLLDNVTGMSCSGSLIATDYSLRPTRPQRVNQQSLAEHWRRRGIGVDVAALSYPGERSDAAGYLASHGWSVRRHDIAELFVDARLPALSARDLEGAPASIGYLSATRE
ncbi:MAG TPA: SAM-dependent methyltransferase [Mycobacterium sp.]